jgi:hypothetical protein
MRCRFPDRRAPQTTPGFRSPRTGHQYGVDALLAVTVVGGTEITPARIIVALLAEAFVVGYLAWAARLFGK